MSELTETKNVVSINGMSWNQCQEAISRLTTKVKPKPVQNILNTLISECTPNVKHAVTGSVGAPVVSPILLSPATLQTQFVGKINGQEQTFKNNGLTPLDARKAAVISLLSEMPIVVQESEQVSRILLEALKATTLEDANEKFKTAFNAIHTGHLDYFKSEVVRIYAETSNLCGFADIAVKEKHKNVLITALNDSGQGVVSEITIDNNQQVNTITEITGIHDGSCTGIMTKFNEELKRRGVVYSKKTKQSTLLLDAEKDLMYRRSKGPSGRSRINH